MLCRAQKCYQVCQPGGIQAWEILKPCVYPETTLSVQHPGAAVREWEGCVEALLTKPRWEWAVSRAVRAAANPTLSSLLSSSKAVAGFHCTVDG